MDTAIVLMAKNPITGYVKTRLAKDLGQEEALTIYFKLLQHTTSVMQSIHEADKFIYHSPEIVKPAKWIPDGFKHRIQSDGRLGERMLNVFHNALNDYKKVILIGADCMVLKERHLTQAIHKLDISEVVLGPSEDGGYYLIGLKKLYRAIFENIDWSTEKVFGQTIDKIENEMLSLATLPELYDIDDKEDWNRWQKESGT